MGFFGRVKNCYKGDKLLKQGKYQEAIEAYNDALEAKHYDDPGYDMMIWYNKGMAFGNLRQYPEALECYNKSLRADPKFVPALYGKSVELAAIKRYDESIRYCDKILRLNPKIKILLGMASIMGKVGEYQKTIECFDRILKLRPRDMINS
jgi:Tfp pilus assembly protein PilF